MKTFALAEQSAVAADSRAWGGHANGRIPTSAMKQVSVVKGSPYLRPDAADAYGRLDAAFRNSFGGALTITEGYRTYDLQYSYFTTRYSKVSYTTNIRFEGAYWALRPGQDPAAVPGTSNHGWGVSCDFGAGVASYGTAQKIWMNKNAPLYGWEPTGDSFGPQEPWHFDYTVPYTGITNPPAAEEDEDMAAIVSVKNAQGNMDYWVIDDGQATRWNAILGLDVNSAGQRLDWYRARGMKFYENQPPQFISPYVDITSKRAAGQA